MLRFVDIKNINEAELKKIEADFWIAEPHGCIHMQPDGIWVFASREFVYSYNSPPGTTVKEMEWRPIILGEEEVMSQKNKSGMNYQLKALRLELGITRKDLDWYRMKNKGVELDVIKQTIIDDE